MVLAPRKVSPAILSDSAYSVSNPPSPCSSACAVFSPTPGTPGMLSEESPIKARKSMISSGGTPYLVTTSSGPRMVLVMVLIRVIPGVTSCAMSLSPVLISTGRPSFSASRARVPMTSSASTPETASNGRPIAFTIVCSGSICARRSSGIGGRWDL
ncbi:hypothetical protein D3C76_1139040 [compost metagenome]